MLLYRAGQRAQCLHEVSELWASLPEPKEQVANSYLLVEYGARLSLDVKEYERAMDWARIALRYNGIRNTKGEGEFLLGKVAFELGDMNTARENFRIANKKSLGRVFQGEDPKYKRLIGGER
jgi:hypothetical protein